MIVVFIVVLVVFGPQKLPELARGLGKLMAEFRKASTDFKSAFEEEMRDFEEPSQSATLATPTGAETLSSEPQTDTRTTEAPVISPVEESVPRSSEEPAEIRSEPTVATNSHDASHDNQQPV